MGYRPTIVAARRAGLSITACAADALPNYRMTVRKPVNALNGGTSSAVPVNEPSAQKARDYDLQQSGVS
jgi:hypothetical protein